MLVWTVDCSTQNTCCGVHAHSLTYSTLLTVSLCNTWHSNTSLVQTSRCGFHYESRAFHFGWMREHENRIASLKVLKYFWTSALLSNSGIGMAATLDLCLTFVECDSTANFHELQEVNHDCVKCREMASRRFSVELALNCDPSKCNCVCIWLHNEGHGLSHSTRLHVCYTSSVVLQESQVIVQTGMWSFLAIAKNVRVPWRTVNWLICIMVRLPWNVGPFCTIVVLSLSHL